jgi:hypothetical protein
MISNLNVSYQSANLEHLSLKITQGN